MRSKRTRAAEFSSKERKAILERDMGECIFCNMAYRIEKTDSYGRRIKEIMHYIPRSAGGLGIRQNAAIGCKSHHMMLDNGNGGHREEMMERFEAYLKRFYKDWNKEDLVFNKWR